MSKRIQDFIIGVAESVVGGYVIPGISAGGALLIALFVALTHGLARWEQAGIIACSAILLLMFMSALYILSLARKERSLSQSQQSSGGINEFESGRLAVLVEYCILLITRCKRLDHDSPREVQYPLSASSFPEHGKPWSSTQIMLSSLRDHLVWFDTLSRSVWKATGNTEDGVALFEDLKVNISMFDLIADLERFQKDLERVWQQRKRPD